MSELDKVMTKHIGGITASARTPGAAPAPKSITVEFEPETREEFLAIVEVIGGIEALSFIPKHEAGYAQNATASRDGIMVMIQEPPGEKKANSVKPSHPFFGPLAERQARERKAAAEQRATDAEAQDAEQAPA